MKDVKQSSRVFLTRVCSSEQGTFGVLIKDGIPLCVTCEDPWSENRRRASCIPVGTYKCVPHTGAKYQNVWRLEDVPKRSAILIHAGNNIDHTEGCILVGRNFGQVLGKLGVTVSGITLEYLRKVLPSNFTLTITEAF